MSDNVTQNQASSKQAQKYPRPKPFPLYVGVRSPKREGVQKSPQHTKQDTEK
jgi:hypothetical protein